MQRPRVVVTGLGVVSSIGIREMMPLVEQERLVVELEEDPKQIAGQEQEKERANAERGER